MRIVLWFVVLWISAGWPGYAIQEIVGRVEAVTVQVEESVEAGPPWTDWWVAVDLRTMTPDGRDEMLRVFAWEARTRPLGYEGPFGHVPIPDVGEDVRVRYEITARGRVAVLPDGFQAASPYKILRPADLPAYLVVAGSEDEVPNGHSEPVSAGPSGKCRPRWMSLSFWVVAPAALATISLGGLVIWRTWKELRVGPPPGRWPERT